MDPRFGDIFNSEYKIQCDDDRHGTETHLGFIQDTKSNDLFTFVLHQASMVNFPYDPVLHDLSLTPRKMSAAETVDFWLGK